MAVVSGPLEESRESRRSRVSSPSAAKSGAASRAREAATASARDMALDVLHLSGPSTLVHPEGLGAALDRDPVESRLGDGELGPVRRVFEPEFHERCRLGGV